MKILAVLAMLTLTTLNAWARDNPILQEKDVDRHTYYKNAAITLSEESWRELSHHSVFFFTLQPPKPNRQISGLYYKSKSQNGKKRLIIMPPIYGSEAGKIISETVTAHLLDSDTNVLTLADNGDLWDWEKSKTLSTVDDLREIAEAARKNIQNEVAGIRRIIDWSRGQEDVDEKKIGIVSFSLGVLVATVAMGEDERIKSGAFVLGGGDIAEILSYSKAGPAIAMQERVWQKLGLKKEELQSTLTVFFSSLNPNLWAARIKERPTLVIEADNDDYIPSPSRRSLREALENPRIIIYPFGHKTTFAFFTIFGFHIPSWKIRGFFQETLP